MIFLFQKWIKLPEGQKLFPIDIWIHKLCMIIVIEVLNFIINNKFNFIFLQILLYAFSVNVFEGIPGQVVILHFFQLFKCNTIGCDVSFDERHICVACISCLFLSWRSNTSSKCTTRNVSCCCSCNSCRCIDI